MHSSPLSFFLGQLEYVAMNASGETHNIRHHVLVGSCPLAFEIVEHPHLEPLPCSGICRLDIASGIKNESVFLRPIRGASKGRAGLSRIQIDDSIEGSHLQLQESILTVIENLGNVGIALKQGPSLSSGDPGNRRTWMRFGQGGKQRSGAQYIAHGIKLDN